MRSISTSLLVLLSSVLVSGCAVRTTVMEVRTAITDHVAGSAIRVESANGHINVAKSDRNDVQIVAELKAISQERLAETRVSVERDSNNQLFVRIDWPNDKRLQNEGCNFDIQVPGANGVTLVSSNGNLEVLKLEGDVDLQTSNGNADVDGPVQNVKIRTSNGNVFVKGASGSIDADTNNGQIEIERARADVIADTSNGKIELSLADDASGPFHLESSNGSISVELNSNYAGLVSCRTSNASIKLDEIQGKIVKDNKTNKSIQIGSESAISEVKTSNGSVEIRQRT